MDVVTALERITKTIGFPKCIQVDNGPEIISKDFDRWAYWNDIVLLKLQSIAEEIFYYEGKRECDFVFQRNNKMEVIQVTQKLDSSNREREMLGLSEAMERFNLNEGIILTEEQAGEVLLEKKKITIKPIWHWLLDS